ncbi:MULTISPECIES: cell wall metabolism sensor histidine kinase WalK [unclassified Clostridium]|uniref:sensor histidine kinase n=1 Tax=unclassified Clostridium TaxID=2614128 RepID=UPI001C8B66D0|nr:MULTISPECIES: HAMP domain-containing sensor histidine kinase [unclassified Clostridium]MBX9138829.1 HAMP domain-containing histidine kinase [Clostridium sp. K12(2020)]MBX9145592.1 HAMP domain-containing histidine kinase [Clostridium sp. K13]
MSLVTSCFYTSSLLILSLSRNIYINNLYKYLSIGISGIGFLSISNILILNIDIGIVSSFNIISRMFYIIFILEVLVFIFSFININKEIKLGFFSLITIGATLLCAYVGFKSSNNILIEIEGQGFNKVKLSVEILIVTLYILLWFIVKRKGEKISKEIIEDFKGYIISRIILAVIVLFTSVNFNGGKILLTYFIRLIGDYFVFKIIGIEVIKRPQETLYNDLMFKSIELEEKLSELKRKNEEEEINKELFANISHEFKTPVNVIYSAIQMQDLKRESNDMNEILKFNSIIKQNCYRLIRLINNFIDSSKLTQQDYNLNLKCLNIVNIVENTTMSILSFAEMKGINVIFDTEEEELFVYADKDLIERTILNILSNAIKYNEENGKIDVLVGTRKENIIIEIEDNGIGIPKEKVKYIFNRYERVQTSEARYKEGSGLGLNIVKEIINKFNGSVKIESEESIGTKITIIIPKIEYNEELYEDYSDGFNFKNDIIQKVDLEMSDICI